MAKVAIVPGYNSLLIHKYSSVFFVVFLLFFQCNVKVNFTIQ